MGIRGVIRNHRVIWVLGFTKYIGAAPPILVEAWALFEGLQIATQLDIDIIKVETDCQTLVHIMTNQFSNKHPMFVIITNCMHLTSKFVEFSLKKIGRKKNKCVDIMTKQVRETPLPIRTFADSPCFVNQVYLEDLRNV